MRRILLVATTLALGGCALYGQYWSRPGATEAQFEAAASGCESAAALRFPPVTMGKPGYYTADNEYCSPTSGGTNCMIIGSGYLPQAQSSADTNALPRWNAFSSCMLAGGWKPSWQAPGEILTPPAPMTAGTVDRALAYCEKLFQGTAETARRPAQFHACVVSRARELIGSRPPA